MIETVAVVVETGFDVEVLCREAMAEEIDKGTGLGDDLAESVVSILGDGVAVYVEVTSDVAVVVVAWNVDHAVAGEVEQPAYSARPLECTGEVFAPIVVDRGGRSVRAFDSLFNKLPLVVEERCGRIGRGLSHAA